MEVVENLKVEKTWAKVVELVHPLANYIVAYVPPYDMVITIEFVYGVPYGVVSFGKAALSAETLSTIAEAKRKKKKTEDACIVRRNNVIYIYLPKRRYFAKFVNGELEYDIPDAENYRNDIYPLDDIAVLERVKEICKQ